MFTILIVSDYLQTAALVARLIEKSGYQVQVYQKDEDLEETYALILFDCDLSPKIGCQKFAALLKRYQNAARLWLSSTGEDELEALTLGFDEWMKKPFHVEVLIARIKKLLKRKRN